MKNIYRILAGAALTVAAVACDINKTPVFNDADAFANFDKTSISVNEDAGTVTIPVTIASLEPMSVAVTYTAVDISARQGEDYVLTDESAVLIFDGNTRTQNIVVNIKGNVGEYTGDLTFRIDLLNAGSLNLGAESSCTVTIVDLDHPLADILGTYTCTATDYALGNQTWTMTMSKDPNDQTAVWIDYICPFAANNPGSDLRVYGNVSEDHKTIILPLGQKTATEYDTDDFFCLCWFNYSGGYKVNTSGNMTFTAEKEGVFTTEDGVGFVTNEYVFQGAMLLPGTSVWTKN